MRVGWHEPPRTVHPEMRMNRIVTDAQQDVFAPRIRPVDLFTEKRSRGKFRYSQLEAIYRPTCERAVQILRRAVCGISFWHVVVFLRVAF